MTATVIDHSTDAVSVSPISGAAGDCFGPGMGDEGWSLSQVLLATGGRFVGGAPRLRFKRIVTDTRTLVQGDLFIALRGDTHDGHLFLDGAIEAGAAGVIVSTLPARAMAVALIMVPDTLTALGDLAAYRRALMPRLRVAAITGSSGKTTVKEMTAAIVEKKYSVLKTKGNFNNLVGLPLSLLPVGPQHDVAILEMGMNTPGEIARLTRIADPDLCCINNVQAAHLEGLGTIEGVARAKGELFAEAKAWALLVVNDDDIRVRHLAADHRKRQITFGLARSAQVRATHIQTAGAAGSRFTLHVGWQKRRVQTAALGRHNVQNSLAAAAIAHGLDIDIDTIAAGIENFQPYDRRLLVETLPVGLRVINDVYNANPASMRAALKTIAEVRAKSEKSLLILADMLELGRESERLHHDLGRDVALQQFTFLATFGEQARAIAAGAREGGMDKVTAFSEKRELIAWVRTLWIEGKLTKGDWVLVKGSRGMRLETVIAELRTALPPRQSE